MSFNERLTELSEKISRKKHLQNVVDELLSEREILERKVNALALVKKDEQDDVDILEGRSLAALFYTVIGKKNEKLDKEKEEARLAAVKYDTAVKELEAVKEDLWKYKDELASLHGCEEKYDALLTEKAAVIQNSENAVSEELLKCEEYISSLINRKKEISEARSAGISAREAANAVLCSLEDAEGYGKWDLWASDSIFINMLKHDSLDNAQNKLETLQVMLRRFKTELTDVRVSCEIQVNMDSFTKFADYFFDCFIMDLKVLDKIQNSLDSVKDTKNQIVSIVNKLDKMLETTDKQLACAQRDKNEIIINADI